ncbi:MAG: lytic transglycosylase domain-containing protein [Chitinophagales bacterium]|jgi:hypothetical protein|nr:lytic transglycosylase domain-containing protein [Chitinophagales bacterium]
MKNLTNLSLTQTLLFVLILLQCYWILSSFSFFQDKPEEAKKSSDSYCIQQKIYSVCKNKKFSFSEEPLPINDPDVLERLDRELLVNTYWQSNTLLTLKLAKSHFAIIEPILKSYNIPDDFKYVCMIESGFRDVVSPAGASGKWQFMKETAKNFNLILNNDIDERYDLIKSTHAACKYFLQAYKELGNWTLVAASYNMGIAGIKNKTNEQLQNSYYNLYLNQETARYVFRIIAMKEIYENPNQYGFYLYEGDYYDSYKTKKVNVMLPINNLADVATEYNTNYKTIRLLNPWIRSKSISANASPSGAVELIVPDN